MNGNGRIHNFTAYIILIHSLRSLRLCESPFFIILKNVLPVSLATLQNNGKLFIG